MGCDGRPMAQTLQRNIEDVDYRGDNDTTRRFGDGERISRSSRRSATVPSSRTPTEKCSGRFG